MSTAPVGWCWRRGMRTSKIRALGTVHALREKLNLLLGMAFLSIAVMVSVMTSDRMYASRMAICGTGLTPG